MIGARMLPAALAAMLAVAPAAADPLVLTKSVTTVSDPLGNTVPRALPGSVTDYRTLVNNPLANLARPVRSVVLVEPLPANVILYVRDLAGAGKGPVEFADGSLLGTGLASSGLSLSYSTTAPAGDGVEFSDGASWAYQPVPDANGYDARVRAIRLTLSGTFATNTSFQLRYRVRIR